MRILLALALVAASSCAVAGDRAAIDATVGRASGGGANVTVDGGLAAVRRVEAGAIDLWASAPVLGVHIGFDAAAPASWTVTVRNCLPDAVLTAKTPDGQSLAAARIAGTLPTMCRFTLDRGQAAALALALRPPDADDPAPFRFAVVSDVQEAIDRVQDIYARMKQDASIRFVLSAGDLTEGGTGEELDRFQRELETLGVPYYATLGNHDIAAGDGLYQRYFGRGSYNFSFRGVDFTLLDSASATIDAAVYDELAGWLDAGRDRVGVVAMHIPPVDPIGERNAAFGSSEEAATLLSRLAAGHVDLTLYGHIHSYYAFTNAGIPAFISGGGGAHPEQLDGIGRHYLTVDIGAAGVVGTAMVPVD